MEIGRRDVVPGAQGAEVREETAPPDRVLEAERWEKVERWPEFRDLITGRMRFIVPATIFFLVYYFLLPLANGLAPDFMRTNVVGNVNIAYLFALSQFVVAWTLAYLYIRRANTIFDRLAAAVRRRFWSEEGTA